MPKVPSGPDNVYGDNRTPTEIERDLENERYWRQTTGDKGSSRNQPRVRLPEQPVPGPSSAPEPNTQSNVIARKNTDDKGYVTKLAREGGVEFMTYLLSEAV